MPTRSGGSATVGRVRRRSPRFGEFRPADNSVPLREEFERRRIAFLERVARARTRQTNKLIAIYTAPATAMQIPQPGRGSPPPLTRLDYENKNYPLEILQEIDERCSNIFVAFGICTGLFIYIRSFAYSPVFEGFEEF